MMGWVAEVKEVVEMVAVMVAKGKEAMARVEEEVEEEVGKEVMVMVAKGATVVKATLVN